jgi:predicted RND superfamily exporter protein
LETGIPPVLAIANTYRSTGKAIVITSIILVLGFSVLLLSSFQTTFTTGLLVSLALLFALFADLLLLPVLLIWYYATEESS